MLDLLYFPGFSEAKATLLLGPVTPKHSPVPCAPFPQAPPPHALVCDTASLKPGGKRRPWQRPGGHLTLDWRACAHRPQGGSWVWCALLEATFPFLELLASKIPPASNYGRPSPVQLALPGCPSTSWQHWPAMPLAITKPRSRVPTVVLACPPCTRLGGQDGCPPTV